MRTGNASLARADAERAAKDGEFGLITSGDERFASTPTGLICFTPGGQSPLTLNYFGHGDYITKEVADPLRYAAAYNHALLEQPGYPYLDLCRVRAQAAEPRLEDPIRVAMPASKVTGLPRDLFEAARRGNARDVRRLLNRKSLDAFDGVGMTALAWAVARNNGPAVNVLLLAGADPWLSGPNDVYDRSATAVFWASALGRRSFFERLTERPGRPFKAWPSSYLAAALSSDDLSIFKHMFAEPHDPLRIELLRRPLPSQAMFEFLLDEQPDLATPLLFKALPLYSEGRPDLVRLALARGANANAIESYETPLVRASKGIYEANLEIVDILLKGGADPNLMSHRARPLWEAFGGIKSDESGRHWKPTGRPRAVFNRLAASGADLNLPNWQGVPPIWFLLFPYSFDRTKLDASSVTPELIEMLVHNGMDVNAKWNGKRVLGAVEEQAGRDSELASALRRLGAKP